MTENNLPLVSVIVPSYNHELYIQECIESIVNQDYSNFELIVIDDGSKDNSAVIIEKLAAKYNFEYVLQKNIGLSATLNKAIEFHAKGKYVIELASDDVMYEGRIKKQVEYMESNPQYGMAYAKAYYIDENSQIIGTGKCINKSGWIFNDLFLGGFNIPAYTCIYKIEVLSAVGYYDELAIIEDSDMFYKIAKKYEIGFVDIYSAYYRRHGKNTSLRFLDLYNDTMRRLNKYKDESRYHEAILIAEKHFFFYLSFNNKREALRLFPIVIKHPFNKFFIAGCLNLLGLKFLTLKYVK